MKPSTRQLGGLAALVLLAAAVSILRILIDRPPGGDVSLAMPGPAYAWVRWTALAVGAAVGSALATSGVLLQALLRNPLASPFILGISTSSVSTSGSRLTILSRAS